MADPSIDRADREVAGYAGVTGVLVVTSVGLAVIRAVPAAGAVMALAFWGLRLTMKAAHRLNAEPSAAPSKSSLNGRLDIRRQTGL